MFHLQKTTFEKKKKTQAPCGPQKRAADVSVKNPGERRCLAPLSIGSGDLGDICQAQWQTERRSGPFLPDFHHGVFVENFHLSLKKTNLGDRSIFHFLPCFVGGKCFIPYTT